MTDDTRKALHLAVKEAYDAGLCVVPPREDGSKAPEGYWSEFIEQRASIEILRDAYRNGRCGMGLVCGRVSNNLECFECETEEVYQKFKAAAALAGLDEIVERIEEGYLELAPGGGRHWLWYSEHGGSGRKLAMAATDDPETPYKTIIETRAEGQYVITAPSYGPVHPSGRPYTRLQGDFATIARITEDDRQALFRVAEAFDECPKSDDGFAMFHPDVGLGGDRPGDVFNQRGDWRHDVLLAAGCTLVGTGVDREGRPQEFWRRSGKDRGNSAVLHPCAGPGGHGLFVPFSTSMGFPATERGYNKFRTYAYLLHGGDFSTAAKALAEQGFKARKKDEAPSPGPPPANGEDEFGGLTGSRVCALEIPDIEHLPVLGVDGFVMEGAANLLYAFPKAGKTELTASLLREWIRLGRTVAYLSEEPLFFWKLRFDDVDEAPEFWDAATFYPAMGWGIDKSLRLIETITPDVLVIDTIRYTLGYQENKGDEDVARVVIPVIQSSRQRGTTLLALYHARKMPGENGTDISGHHSLYGAFDRAVQLRRIDGEENEKKRRLVVSGRLLDPLGTTKLTYVMRDDGEFQALDVASIIGFEKVCEVCNKQFKAKRSTAQFCGQTCRKRAYRRDGE